MCLSNKPFQPTEGAPVQELVHGPNVGPVPGPGLGEPVGSRVVQKWTCDYKRVQMTGRHLLVIFCVVVDVYGHI